MAETARSPFKPARLIDLHDMLIRAAETERALPAAIRKQKMASWPEYPNEWTAYAYSDVEPRLPRPTSVAIDEYGYAIDLVLSVPDRDDRQLLWATAHSAAYRDRGPSWRLIGKVLHVDPRTAKRRYETALLSLWYLV